MLQLISHRTKSSLIRYSLCLTLLVVGSLAAAQDIPRTADGRPDFNGIWQAINTANWDVEPHAAGFGPLVAAGAIGGK